jgi:hypothetical protein
MLNKQSRGKVITKNQEEEYEEYEDYSEDYINHNYYEDDEENNTVFKPNELIDETKKPIEKYKMKKHLNKGRLNVIQQSEENVDELYDDVQIGNEYDPELEEMYNDDIKDDENENQLEEFIDDNLYHDDILDIDGYIKPLSDPIILKIGKINTNNLI